MDTDNDIINLNVGGRRFVSNFFFLVDFLQYGEIVTEPK